MIRLIRLALICPNLNHGGAERQLVRLALGLRDVMAPLVIVLDGAEPNVLARELVEHGVPIHFAPVALSHVGVARWLAVLLRSQHVDVAHSFLWRADATLALAARLNGFRNVICSERGDRLAPYYASTRWIPRRALDRLLVFPTARALISNSTAGAAAARDAGCDAAKIHVIANWVDLTAADTAIREGAALRTRLGWQEALVAGFVGRLSTDKGASRFVPMARAVVDRLGASVRFLIVGDGPLRPDIEAQIRAAGLNQVVHLAGAVSSSFPYIQAVDVGVICSPSESFPNVLLEYMACRKPVVATSVGGLKEAVHDGVTGRLVEDSTAGALAKPVVELLQNAAMRSALGSEARRAVEARYQAPVLLSRYLAVYRQIAKGE